VFRKILALLAAAEITRFRTVVLHEPPELIPRVTSFGILGKPLAGVLHNLAVPEIRIVRTLLWMVFVQQAVVHGPAEGHLVPVRLLEVVAAFPSGLPLLHGAHHQGKVLVSHFDLVGTCAASVIGLYVGFVQTKDGKCLQSSGMDVYRPLELQGGRVSDLVRSQMDPSRIHVGEI